MILYLFSVVTFTFLLYLDKLRGFFELSSERLVLFEALFTKKEIPQKCLIQTSKKTWTVLLFMSTDVIVLIQDRLFIESDWCLVPANAIFAAFCCSVSRSKAKRHNLGFTGGCSWQMLLPEFFSRLKRSFSLPSPCACSKRVASSYFLCIIVEWPEMNLILIWCPVTSKLQIF